MPACCMPCLARWLPHTQFIERNVAQLAFCAKGTPCVFYSRALFFLQDCLGPSKCVNTGGTEREASGWGKLRTVVSMGASSLSISGGLDINQGSFPWAFWGELAIDTLNSHWISRTDLLRISQKAPKLAL